MTESAARALEDKELDLIDYAVVVWRRRWLIGGICAVSLAATLAVSILMPKVYESTATMLVPKEGTGSDLLGGLAASGILQQAPGLSVPSLTPNRDMLVSILRSRTVAQAVVERFRLKERYKARYLEDAIKALADTTKVIVSREGAISVTVADTGPQVAAEIANFYVEQADRLVAQYGMGDAGRQRVFLAEQFARAKVDLEGAEENLRKFQERHRAVALEEQTRGAIEAAARLKGEIMAGEVQLQVMRNFATEANPEVVTLKRRIEEMRRQLARMQYGDGGPPGATTAAGQDRHDFSVPLPKVPEVGLELARLTRDVKVQATLVTLLAQQLEQAKIAEVKDLPIVRVLDRAVPAELHARPSLKLNLTIAGVASFLVGIFAAFLVEYVENTRRGRRAKRAADANRSSAASRIGNQC